MGTSLLTLGQKYAYQNEFRRVFCGLERHAKDRNNIFSDYYRVIFHVLLDHSGR